MQEYKFSALETAIAKISIQSEDRINELSMQLRSIYFKDEKLFWDIINDGKLVNISKHSNLKKLLIRTLYWGINNETEDIEKLLDLYNKLSEKIVSNIDYHTVIELLTYANYLVEHAYIDKSLDIIRKIKLLDKKFKEDKQIVDRMNKYIATGQDAIVVTSTKGWIAWVLMKCTVEKGRDYIKEILETTEELTKDDNLYIKFVSLWPLDQLARNRLTHSPDDKSILFFSDDRKTALERSKKVEKMIIELLNEISEKDNKIKKSFAHNLAYTLNNIRALNNRDAIKVLGIIEHYESEPNAVKEFAPILVYFAFLRKWAFKNWEYKTEGLYDDLKDFNQAKKYYEYLKELIELDSKEINNNIAHNILSIAKSEKKEKLQINTHDINEFRKEYVKSSSDLFENMIREYNERVFFNVFEFIMIYINEFINDLYPLIKKFMKIESIAFIKMPHPYYYAMNEIGDDIFVPVYNELGSDKLLELLKTFIEYHNNPNFMNRDLNLNGTYDICKEEAAKNQEYEIIRSKLEQKYSYLK